MEQSLFLFPQISLEDAASDIDVILWSMRMSQIRRFHSPVWQEENRRADEALKIDPYPRLENVAEHTCFVVDMAMLLVGHFPELDAGYCLKLAVIHDKTEIITGDDDACGNNFGKDTHTFNEKIRAKREAREAEAIEQIVARLRPSVRQEAAAMYWDMLKLKSQEARFIKTVDKLEALLFVLIKKDGSFLDEHLVFNLKYTRMALCYFPRLVWHFEEVRKRMIARTAEVRGVEEAELEAWAEKSDTPP